MTYDPTLQCLTVNRITEDGWILLDRGDEQRVSLPADWLPEDIREGDTLSLRLKKERMDCNLRLFIKHKAHQEAYPVDSQGDVTAAAA